VDIGCLKIEEFQHDHEFQTRVTSRRENYDFLACKLRQQEHKVGFFVQGGPEEVTLVQSVHSLVLCVHFDEDGVVQGGSLQFLHFRGHRRTEEVGVALFRDLRQD